MDRVEKINLNEAIALSESFSMEVLGIKVDLRQQFDFPTELPWNNVLVIYDPGFSNREALDKTLKAQKLGVYEEVDVMTYSGSEALKGPTLYIIENSVNPTGDTLGKSAKSPDQLSIDGRLYLDQRNYMIAFGLRYFGFKDYLDPETWTWFPKNSLPSGKVGCGGWRPYDGGVRFCWSGSGRVGPGMGARLAIPVSLKS